MRIELLDLNPKGGTAGVLDVDGDTVTVVAGPDWLERDVRDGLKNAFWAAGVDAGEGLHAMVAVPVPADLGERIVAMTRRPLTLSDGRSVVAGRIEGREAEADLASRPEIGPQYQGDTQFQARMRFHQSWYRSRLLRVTHGTGPQAGSEKPLGNMLADTAGTAGMNFLDSGIFDVVRARLALKTGTVDEYRLLNNMLSSQPMCFNLFGPMVDDLGLATRVFSRLLPDRVRQVTAVKIEYAPEPASEFLADRTAFDAFVEYQDVHGRPGFVGIETKLTEAFSPDEYDRKTYRVWSSRPDSPWPEEAWPGLAEKAHNQLWRDHLLAVAMRHHPRSTYESYHFMLIHHPLDRQIAGTVAHYKSLLKPEDRSFGVRPLDDLVFTTIRYVLEEARHHAWLTAFSRRYLDLHLSQQEWEAHCEKTR